MLGLESLRLRVGAHLNVGSMDTAHILDEEVPWQSDEFEDYSSYVDG